MKKELNRDNGVLQKAGAPCIIDNGANLHSMYLLESLFDYGQYVERESPVGNFEVLGFIDGGGVMVKYKLNTSEMTIKAIQPLTPVLRESYRKLLPELLTDEQIRAEIIPNEAIGEYKVFFFWNIYD